MKYIRNRVFSHVSLELDTEKKSTNKEVRSTPGQIVYSFQELTQKIAKISYYNPEYNLFFRGQNNDYTKGKNKESVIIPTFYRKHKKLRNIKQKIEYLNFANELLLEKFQERNYPGIDRLSKYKEVGWSILQHYDICPTPLLDVTSSLRVACSFALLTENTLKPVIYVLGLNNIHSSISYSVEEEMMNIKLSSICPPVAIRPFYQDGYLAGVFPNTDNTLTVGFDFSKRLIAKFELDPTNFWNTNFLPIPENALYPNDLDPFYKASIDIKRKLDDKFFIQTMSEKRKKSLLNRIYSSNLETEVFHLFMCDWSKEDILNDLLHKGYNEIKIEEEFQKIKEWYGI